MLLLSLTQVIDFMVICVLSFFSLGLHTRHIVLWSIFCCFCSRCVCIFCFVFNTEFQHNDIFYQEIWPSSDLSHCWSELVYFRRCCNSFNLTRSNTVVGLNWCRAAISAEKFSSLDTLDSMFCSEKFIRIGLIGAKEIQMFIRMYSPLKMNCQNMNLIWSEKVKWQRKMSKRYCQ